MWMAHREINKATLRIPFDIPVVDFFCQQQCPCVAARKSEKLLNPKMKLFFISIAKAVELLWNRQDERWNKGMLAKKILISFHSNSASWKKREGGASIWIKESIDRSQVFGYHRLGVRLLLLLPILHHYREDWYSLCSNNFPTQFALGNGCRCQIARKTYAMPRT